MAYDINAPLVHVSELDYLSIKHSFEGIMCFGGTGSGKSSGVSNTFLRRMMQSHYGGLMLTVKDSDFDDYYRLAQEAGREKDIIRFSPSSPYVFDFLAAEAGQKNGADGGAESEDLINLFMAIIAIANGGEVRSKESYWLLALRQLLRNTICLLECAGEAITMPNMYRLIVSAPGDEADISKHMAPPEKADPPSHKPYFFQCMDKMLSRNTQLANDVKGECFEDMNNVGIDYWTKEYPNLAEKTRSIIVSMFTTSADSFLRGSLRSLFGAAEGKYDISPVCTRAGALMVIDVPLIKEPSVGRIANGVMKLCFQRILQRTPINDETRPVFIHIDECQYHMSDLDAAFQQLCRSARISSIYLSQALPGMQINLGEGKKAEMALNSILGNLSTKIFCAQSEPDTNEFASRIFGEIYQKVGGSSASYNDQGELNSNSSINEQKRRVIEPIAFHKLKRGGPENDFIVSAIMHQVGRTFEATGTNYLHVNFSQR